MSAEEVAGEMKKKFPEADVRIPRASRLTASVKKDVLLDVCSFLKDAGFDHLSSIAGVDRAENFEVAYFLWSYEKKILVTLKTAVQKENPRIQSVIKIWEGANWHEREAYDMFGIVFEGHPDLRRILMPEDFVGHPLRKDFKLPEVE
jgi:NADH/F420H2 dehydrogenase subunit C